MHRGSPDSYRMSWSSSLRTGTSYATSCPTAVELKETSSLRLGVASDPAPVTRSACRRGCRPACPRRGPGPWMDRLVVVATARPADDATCSTGGGARGCRPAGRGSRRASRRDVVGGVRWKPRGRTRESAWSALRRRGSSAPFAVVGLGEVQGVLLNGLCDAGGSSVATGKGATSRRTFTESGTLCRLCWLQRHVQGFGRTTLSSRALLEQRQRLG